MEVPVSVSSVVLKREDDWVVGWVMLAEANDSMYGFLEIDGLAKWLVIESMGNDRPVAVIVHVSLHAFNSSF